MNVSFQTWHSSREWCSVKILPIRMAWLLRGLVTVPHLWSKRKHIFKEIIFYNAFCFVGRFSIECAKVILISRLLWFCVTTLRDWFRELTPLSQPMRSKTKTNHDLVTRAFPRLVPVTCICFELNLIDPLCCLRLW